MNEFMLNCLMNKSSAGRSVKLRGPRALLEETFPKKLSTSDDLSIMSVNESEHLFNADIP